MAGGHRHGKRLLATLMIGTVVAVIGYGTAVAANVVSTPMGDAENPNPSPSPQSSYVVTINKAGHGFGLVTSKPKGIHCGDSCIASFPAGTHVLIFVTPGAGTVLRAYGNACQGNKTCVLHMNASKTVQVLFAPRVGLSVGRTGKGFVGSGGRGIHCPGSCAKGFAKGSTVRLSPHAAHGWHLKSWSGACHGHAACRVHLNVRRHAVAHFSQNHA